MNDLDQTKADAGQARGRLRSTVNQLRARLRPASLASDAIALAQKGGKGAVISAASSAKTRPLLAVGMIVAGVGYLLRKPILSVIAKRLAKETDNAK